MNLFDIEMLAKKVEVPIRKLSAKDMIKLKDAPQAQKRTADFKKHVYIVEDLVFKGPYNSDDHMLIKNLRYTYALQLLEEALQLPEWRKGSLGWEYLGCWNNDQYYMAAPNVGNGKNICFEIVTTKIETNVPVVPRGKTVKRVSDMEKIEPLTDDIKSATLQHLYLRFLLDIGDSGTHNILIREDYVRTGRLIAGIDLEEKRAIKEKESRLNHLFKKTPSKLQESLYASKIRKIKSLSYSQLDQRTIARLSAVEIDLRKLKENMELWVRLE